MLEGEMENRQKKRETKKSLKAEINKYKFQKVRKFLGLPYSS